MSDWLNDNASDEAGYLGLDDPAMPDTAPAPPTAADAEDWLGGNSGGAPAEMTPTATDDWLGADTAAPAGNDFAMPEPSPMSAPAPVATMAPSYDSQPAPMPAAASFNGDLQVAAPMLEHVQPNPRSLGGTRGQLSSLVLDVEVQVEVALGNAALTVEEFLEMGRGSVVELDKPIDAPIELKVRGKLIARGQLVSINGAYGMRIIEMLNEEN